MRTLEPYSTNPAGFRRAWTRDTLRWVGAGTGAKGKGAGDGSEDEDDGVSWTSRRIKYWQWKSWENTTRCTNAFRFLPEALLNHLVEMYFGFPHVYLMSTSSPVSPKLHRLQRKQLRVHRRFYPLPLNNAFDFRQNYPPAKSSLPTTIFPGAVLVYVSQQQQQQQIHAPLPSHDLAAAADDWRAQQAYRPAPKSDYPATSAHQIMCTNQLYSGGGGGGLQRSYSANTAYGYQQSQQHRTRPTRTPTRSPTRSRTRPRSHTQAQQQAQAVDPRCVLFSPTHHTTSSTRPHSPASYGQLACATRPPSARNSLGSVRSSPAHSPLQHVLALGEDKRTFRATPATANGNHTSNVNSHYSQSPDAGSPSADGGDSEYHDDAGGSDSDGDFLPPGARRPAPRAPRPELTRELRVRRVCVRRMVPPHGHGYLDAEFFGDAGGGGGGGGGAEREKDADAADGGAAGACARAEFDEKEPGKEGTDCAEFVWGAGVCPAAACV
ncbi:hypothetical protein B0H14DRAFT_3571310 [Mycena olivaceomarginata]|nr:hypothetical protein B0H14DRAFT_3571310 [Mycena olivaceomarginata]